MQSIRGARAGVASGGESGARAGALGGNAYLQGLISTVLNPKPALFFLSYVPQFVDRDGSVALPVALLAAIHIAIGFLWLTFYASLVARRHAVLARPRVKAVLARVTGAVLIGLGLRVATERQGRAGSAARADHTCAWSRSSRRSR